MYFLHVVVFYKIVLIVLSCSDEMYDDENISTLQFITVNNIYLRTQLNKRNRLHTTTYYYGEDDVIETACHDYASTDGHLQVKYYYAKSNPEMPTPEVWSRVSPGNILFHIRMGKTHNNSYLICTGAKYHVIVTYVLRQKLYDLFSLNINGLPVWHVGSKQQHLEVIFMFSNTMKYIYLRHDIYHKDVSYAPNCRRLCALEDTGYSFYLTNPGTELISTHCALQPINGTYHYDVTIRNIGMPSGKVDSKHELSGTTHNLSTAIEDWTQWAINLFLDDPAPINKSNNYFVIILILVVTIVVVFMVIFAIYRRCKRSKTNEVTENIYEDINYLENVPPATQLSNPAINEPAPPADYDYTYEREMVAVEPRRTCPRHGEHRVQPQVSSTLEYDYVYDGMFRS